MKKVQVLLLFLFCLMSSLAFSQESTLIPSEKGKTIPKKEMLKPLLFRWTPIAARANEAVTYRLKVWQLKQGQTNEQALQTKPLLTKDVQNSAETTVSNLATNPCKPPYSCTFIWQVEALDKNTSAIIGGNSLINQLFSFTLLDDNINIKLDSIHVGCCTNDSHRVQIWVKNMHATNQARITAIRYRVNGTGVLTTLAGVSPTLPVTMSPNSSQAFTGTIIRCRDSMKTVKFLVEAVWPSDIDNINIETGMDTLHCCKACDSLSIPMPTVIAYNNNILSFNQAPLSTKPFSPIKSIQADLVYFEMTPENDDCLPCDKDAATYGHFLNGTNSLQHLGSGPLAINITTPQLTPCCSAVFRWCIRYKITLEDCSSCTKVVCYEKRKTGCTPQPILFNNQK
jgi:hypothetical protein